MTAKSRKRKKAKAGEVKGTPTPPRQPTGSIEKIIVTPTAPTTK